MEIECPICCKTYELGENETEENVMRLHYLAWHPRARA